MNNKNKIIEQLVETRINGNSIANNKTYLNMLKRVTKEDIQYSEINFYNIKLYGSKIEMIEQLKESVILK